MGLPAPGPVTSIIGIDPGGTTGICFLDYIGPSIAGKTLLQVDGPSALIVLEAMLTRYYADPQAVVKRAAGVEPFITGQSAGTRGQPAEVTRQQAFQATELLQLWGYNVQLRKAADIKVWATDKRLKAAGLLGPPEMRHANDGARQALYTAKHDLYKADPLR